MMTSINDYLQKRRNSWAPLYWVLGAGSVGLAVVLLICFVKHFENWQDQRGQSAPLGAEAAGTEEPEDKNTPTADDDWYKGGTLSKKTLLDWEQASRPDRLASAADLVMVFWSDTNMNNLRERAEHMEERLNGITDKFPYIDRIEAKVSVSFAAALIVYMEAEGDTLFFGTLLDWERFASQDEQITTLVRFYHVQCPTAGRGLLLDLADETRWSLNREVTDFPMTNRELDKYAVSGKLMGNLAVMEEKLDD